MLNCTKCVQSAKSRLWNILQVKSSAKEKKGMEEKRVKYKRHKRQLSYIVQELILEWTGYTEIPKEGYHGSQDMITSERTEGLTSLRHMETTVAGKVLFFDQSGGYRGFALNNSLNYTFCVVDCICFILQ